LPYLLVRFLQGDRQHGPRFQIHRVLGFVRQMCPAISHLGDPRVSIMRIHPILIAGLVLPRAIEPR